MAYYVDRNPEQENDFERNCEPCFPKFKKLKDAREYAEYHGDEDLGPLPVLDKNGDLVPWPEPKQTKAELRTELESTKQIIKEYQDSVAGASRLRERDHEAFKQEREDLARRMLVAGYIPLDRLRGMIGGQINGYSTEQGSYYTISLIAYAGETLPGDIMTAIITGEYTP